MSYQHIAVATSLLDEERMLIDKGVSLATALSAKLSLIYVDEHHSYYYSELGRMVHNFSEQSSKLRSARDAAHDFGCDLPHF